ncbi:MAG: nitronate monooxygenase [Planctomycetota bacterium]|nr:nitronate monooxygenase [Planctomycetota bacterium]
MADSPGHPSIIQGGMGVAVSDWRLARAVSETGQLGVVAGTALDIVLSRRLQLGDIGGNLKRAMDAFPIPEIAQRVWQRFFVPGGKAPQVRFKSQPLPSIRSDNAVEELAVLANFVEVYLAKEGHKGRVGINYLTKIQLPTLSSLFGALLAGVDYVLMGAGIPKTIPSVLDRLVAGEPVDLKIDVTGEQSNDEYRVRFDPVEFCRQRMPTLRRPKFLAIVSSSALATMLARRSSGHVDGFVVEGSTAGGHNAPPRGAMQLDDQGEPVYGERDLPDLAVFRSLERPFWLAGSYGSAERVVEALQAGAAGVQVGTAFAFCRESGLRSDIKRDVLEMVRQDAARVRTDPAVSPAGFPFKVLNLPGSMSEADCYKSRKPVCDLGFLRHAYSDSEGALGWRCPAENVESYLRKGGSQSDTVGRKCICNALLANIGLEQVQAGGRPELPLVTCGDDVAQITSFLPTPDAEGYSAQDVVAHLLPGVAATGRGTSP